MTDSQNLRRDFFPPSLAALMNRDAHALGGLTRREVHLQLPPGFLLRLLDAADDWTFIVQLHALLETSVEHVLTVELGRPELGEFVDRLNISGGRTSKAALGEMIGSFNEADLALIHGLSEMRNAFGHNIRMVGLSIGDYVNRLPADRQIGIATWVARAHGFEKSEPIVAEAKRALVMQPRYVLWHAASRLIDRAYAQQRSARERAIAEEFGLTTEDGRQLTTEHGHALVQEAAPDVDDA